MLMFECALKFCISSMCKLVDVQSTARAKVHVQIQTYNLVTTVFQQRQQISNHKPETDEIKTTTHVHSREIENKRRRERCRRRLRLERS